MLGDDVEGVDWMMMRRLIIVIVNRERKVTIFVASGYAPPLMIQSDSLSMSTVLVFLLYCFYIVKEDKESRYHIPINE